MAIPCDMGLSQTLEAKLYCNKKEKEIFKNAFQNPKNNQVTHVHNVRQTLPRGVEYGLLKS